MISFSCVLVCVLVSVVCSCICFNCSGCVVLGRMNCGVDGSGGISGLGGDFCVSVVLVMKVSEVMMVYSRWDGFMGV